MKSIEYYIALGSAMLFVALQHKEKPWAARVAIAGISGGLGNAVSPELAARIVWMGEVTAMVAVTALIYAVLDTASALVADREVILDLVRRTKRGR